MLPIAEFISNLAKLLGNAIQYLSHVRQENRKKQSKYLDKVSETLASAAAAIQNNKSPSEHLAELRYHLEFIGEVLYMGQPGWIMCVSDRTVLRLQKELDAALRSDPSALLPPTEATPSPRRKEREKFKEKLLNASGVFRGAAIVLRTMKRAPRDK